MLKSLLNKRGVISWLFSQIALILATGILLASIVGIGFYSDWRKEAEIKAIASELASWIYTMDLRTEENITKFWFPEKDFYYTVNISTDYIVIERYDGRIKDRIRVAYPLFIKPFIIKNGLDLEWKNAKELHEKIKEKREFGRSGYIGEALPSSIKNEVKNYINNELNKISLEIAREPLQVNIDEPLILENCVIHFEDGSILNIVLVYQEEENEI